MGLLSVCCGGGVPPLDDDMRSVVATATDADDSTSGAASATPKDGERMGYFSNHGWETKRTLLGGQKPTRPKINQDRIFITPRLCGVEDGWLFACYDGNGPKGHHVAQAAGQEMVKQLEAVGKKLFASESTAGQHLALAFAKTNEKLIKHKYSEKSGTTATAVLIHGKTVHVANVADSTAVRVVEANGEWTASVLTTTHKPSIPEEKARIEASGGCARKGPIYARRAKNPPCVCLDPDHPMTTLYDRTLWPPLPCVCA